jgi:hypothetical protein
MPTNFPVSYDTTTELGGPFVNVVPPADPLRNIDADRMNNSNDSIMAIEARVGRLGETNTGTLDWATLTVAGAPSQGLRFAGSHVAWPGLQAEPGLFIDSATNHVCFHLSGDPLGTFTDLTAGGGAGTWDALYDASDTMAIDTVARTLTWTSSIPQTGFLLDRTTAFVSQLQPLLVLRESGAIGGSTPQPLLHLYGGGASLDYAGVLSTSRPCLTLWRQPDGYFMQMLTGTEAVPGDVRFTFYATGRFEIGADTPDPLLYVTQNNAAGSLMAFFNSPNNVLFGVDANGAIFCSSNPAASALLGLYNDGNDRLVVSTDGCTALSVASDNTALSVVHTGSISAYILHLSDGVNDRLRVKRTGVTTIQGATATIFTPGLPILDAYQMSTGNIAALYSDDGGLYVDRYGSTRVVSIDPTDAGLRVYQGGTSALLQLYNYPSNALRFSVAANGGVTMLAVDGIATSVLTLQQDDRDQPFIKCVGFEAPDATRSISTNDGDGAVSAPHAPSASQGWVLKKMVRIDINGSHYWLPAYDAVAP